MHRSWTKGCCLAGPISCSPEEFLLPLPSTLVIQGSNFSTRKYDHFLIHWKCSNTNPWKFRVLYVPKPTGRWGSHYTDWDNGIPCFGGPEFLLQKEDKNNAWNSGSSGGTYLVLPSQQTQSGKNGSNPVKIRPQGLRCCWNEGLGHPNCQGDARQWCKHRVCSGRRRLRLPA